MTAQTYKARDVAKAVSKATGRPINDKRVRAWVRDNVAAFDDDGYTAHVYSTAQYKAIVKGMTDGSKAERSKAASAGRTPSKRKATATPRNVAPDGRRTTRPPQTMSGDAPSGDA